MALVREGKGVSRQGKPFAGSGKGERDLRVGTCVCHGEEVGAVTVVVRDG